MCVDSLSEDNDMLQEEQISILIVEEQLWSGEGGRNRLQSRERAHYEQLEQYVQQQEQ